MQTSSFPLGMPPFEASVVMLFAFFGLLSCFGIFAGVFAAVDATTKAAAFGGKALTAASGLIIVAAPIVIGLIFQQYHI